MVIKAQLAYCIFLIFEVLFAGATYDEIISDKKKQADIIEKEILENKSLISAHFSESAKLKVQIDSIESEISALNSFLKNYDNESYMSPDRIASETRTVISLSQEVDKRQESFKKKIIDLYKHGKNYELELLLSSKTPNEYLRRNQYLQRFSQTRKKELKDLKAKKMILDEKKKMLTLSTSSRRFYVESKRTEREDLQARLINLNNIKDKSEYESTLMAAKITRYESQLNNIKNFISNFQDNRENFTDKKNNRLNYESSDLGAVKGNINIPIDVGLVISEYGNSVSGASYSISFNNGIDFSLAKGSKVYSAASGVVTLTGEAPYYGKVIIIKHENGFRTVYADLSEVNVNPGDIVKLNQVIGKTGDSIDGQLFHFELWQNGIPLNPAEWLRL